MYNPIGFMVMIKILMELYVCLFGQEKSTLVRARVLFIAKQGGRERQGSRRKVKRKGGKKG